MEIIGLPGSGSSLNRRVSVGKQVQALYKPKVPFVFRYQRDIKHYGSRRNKGVGDKETMAEAVAFQQGDCIIRNLLINFDDLETS